MPLKFLAETIMRNSLETYSLLKNPGFHPSLQASDYRLKVLKLDFKVLDETA
jgi:hypothetical protein